MVQETSMKKLHSKERKEPYNTLNRTEQITLNKNCVKNSHRKEKRTATKSTPLLGKKRKKGLHSEERKKPYNTLNRTQQTTSKKNWVKFFLTCPMLACSCWEFILHILCWLLDVGSFYYTSCAWCFMWGVSLTHPLLASLCGEFLLHILCRLPYVGSFSYTSCAGFFVWGIFLTHTVLASLCGEFLLHVLC